MAKQFYFVSDLHFGGDGQLQVCDFAEEFIAVFPIAAKSVKGTRGMVGNAADADIDANHTRLKSCLIGEGLSGGNITILKLQKLNISNPAISKKSKYKF